MAHKITITPAGKQDGYYTYHVRYNQFAVNPSEITIIDRDCKGWTGNTFVSTPYGTGFATL